MMPAQNPTQRRDQPKSILRTVQRPTRNPVIRLLHWASQTDPNIIPICGWWTRQTQAALGFFVLFTATMAGFSAFYTLTTLNVWAPFNFILALLWFLFILFCDRFVVASLNRRAAIIRPLLSFFIGLLVAVPVELWVFQDRVDQEIDKVYRADNQEPQRALAEGQKDISLRRVALQRRYEDLLLEEKHWGDVMDGELVGRAGQDAAGSPERVPSLKTLRNNRPVYTV